MENVGLENDGPNSGAGVYWTAPGENPSCLDGFSSDPPVAFSDPRYLLRHLLLRITVSPS